MFPHQIWFDAKLSLKHDFEILKRKNLIFIVVVCSIGSGILSGLIWNDLSSIKDCEISKIEPDTSSSSFDSQNYINSYIQRINPVFENSANANQRIRKITDSLLHISEGVIALDSGHVVLKKERLRMLGLRLAQIEKKQCYKEIAENPKYNPATVLDSVRIVISDKENSIKATNQSIIKARKEIETLSTSLHTKIILLLIFIAITILTGLVAITVPR